MFPILQIGPLVIQVPGLLLLAGLWLGLTLSERVLLENKPRKLTGQDLNNLTLVGLGAAILAARLGYVLRFPSAFNGNPMDLLSLSPALLDPGFGILGGLIAATAFVQRKRLPASLVIDAMTPLFAVMAAAWYLSNLSSGFGFGLPTDLPWGIDLFGARRHPTQIYDSIAALATLAFIWRSRKDYKFGEGKFFLTFILITAGLRIFLEAFHATGMTVWGGWRVNQIVAWPTLCLGLLSLRRQKKFQGR